MEAQTQQDAISMIEFDLAQDDDFKFGHLYPPSAEAVLAREASYGIGIAVQDGELYTPAGVIIFSLDMTNDREDISSIVELNWLYVSEKYRHMGVGKRLIELFSGIIIDADMDCVVCDVPLNSDYDELVSYLENWGFFFRLTEKNEHILHWSELQDHPILSKPEKTEHVQSLKNLPRDSLRHCLKSLKLTTWLSIPEEELDQDLSCISFNNSKPNGVFLIRRNPDIMVEPLLLRGEEGSGDYSPVIEELLFYVLRKLRGPYRKMSYIYVMIRSLEGAKLWDHLFPDTGPVLMRRGVYLLEEEENA